MMIMDDESFWANLTARYGEPAAQAILEEIAKADDRATSAAAARACGQETRHAA